MSQTLNATTYDLTKGVQEQAYIDAMETAFKGIYKATLTVGAESANVITVTGVLKDLFGKAATATKLLWVSTSAVTADKGDIAVTVGTEQAKQNPATGDNVASILAAADGTFAFTVTNSAAEKTSCVVSVDGGLSTVVTLDFSLV
jgi:hypothetical protein